MPETAIWMPIEFEPGNSPPKNSDYRQNSCLNLDRRAKNSYRDHCSSPLGTISIIRVSMHSLPVPMQTKHLSQNSENIHLGPANRSNLRGSPQRDSGMPGECSFVLRNGFE